MGKFESISAIHDYKSRNHILENRNGISYKATIYAENATGGSVFREETDFYFSTNKYGYEEVVIEWKLTPETYHSLGLSGAYSTASYQFECIGNKLVIQASKMTIIIGSIL